jgi:hypothetical protein
MRTLLLLGVVALAGCGTIANTEFDNVEAGRYVDVAVASRLLADECSKHDRVFESLPTLNYLVAGAYKYSALKTNNSRIAEAGKILASQVADLNIRYTTGQPSQSYCSIKLTGIADGAEMVARSLGKKELESPVAIK